MDQIAWKKKLSPPEISLKQEKLDSKLRALKEIKHILDDVPCPRTIIRSDRKLKPEQREKAFIAREQKKRRIDTIYLGN